MDLGNTSEQKKQLETWSEQRDALLIDISNLRTAKEKLQAENREVAESNTEIQNNIIELRGRIEEIKIKRKEMFNVITNDIANLNVEKAGLEAQIPLLREIVKELSSQKTANEIELEGQLRALELAKADTLNLKELVATVTTVSKLNTDRINNLVSDLGDSLEAIVSVNKKNVEETNLVLEKLPAMLMELQKHGLIKPRQAILKNNN